MAFHQMIRVLWVLAGVLASVALYSDEDFYDDRLRDLSLDELLNIPVVVASRKLEYNFTAPSSVTVFSRRQIKELGVSSVEELLNYVPGFQASRDVFLNQGYRVGARGLITPQNSYSILFLIDGQRLNTDLSGGALLSSRFLSTANIKKVEVIRGPGSAMYGTSAFSGVVNIVTDNESNEAFLGVGDIGSREVYAKRTLTFSNWDLSGFFRYYSDDGQHYDSSFTEDINPSIFFTQDPKELKEMYASARWNDWLTFNLRAAHGKLDDFVNFQFLSNGEAYAQFEQNSISMIANAWQTDDFQLDVKVSFLDAREEQREELGGDLGVYHYASSEWQVELDGVYNLSESTINGGLSFRKASIDEYHFTLDTDGSKIALGPTDDRNIQAAYLQYHKHLSKKLQLTLGVRTDFYSGTGASTNPRAALVYSKSKNTSFKLLYGEAFRAPNRFQTSDIFLGNPSLKSEKIATSELAWLQDYSSFIPVDSMLQSTVTLFHNQHDNQIRLVPGGGPFGLSTENNPEKFQSSGIEFELVANILNDLSVRASYTNMFEIEQFPNEFSESFYSFIMNYDKTNWSLNFSGFYRGKVQQDIVDNNGSDIATLDDYWHFNTCFKLALNPSVQLVIKVNNLTDQRYYSPSVIRTMRKGVENKGRHGLIGIEMQL